jgi:two-component system NarL family sensor kinase
LSFEKSILSITVEDDGKGFDSRTIDELKSSGWKNIRSRVDFLQGAADIRSASSGTSVHLQLPILSIP